MELDIVLFYYTLIILLASVLTAALCIASYLVSHMRALLYAFLGFLFYFFDVALVFQDDFLMQGVAATSPFFIGSPFVAIVIGGGALLSLWLVLCEYLDERRPALRWAPIALFAGASVAVLLLVQPGNIQEFLFYSMREITLYWMLIYCALVYATTRDEVKRLRMKRYRRFYLILWVLVTLVLLENVVFLLVVDPHVPMGSPLPFYPERNFAENALVIFCAMVACRSSWRNLNLRRNDPPTRSDASLEAFIDQNLPTYRIARQLSQREEEILRFVLLGMDNQNIATSLQLAAGTVKVHMHNILKKTGCGNRKELIQDFWEFL